MIAGVLPQAEPITLTCMNDACSAFDADGEMVQGHIVYTPHRFKWESHFIYEDDGRSGYNEPETARCRHCGAEGEEL